MKGYSVQPKDRIFVKRYGLLSFAKSMGKKVKHYVVNTAKNFLLTLNSLEQMHLKLLQKESFKKQQRQLLI